MKNFILNLLAVVLITASSFAQETGSSNPIDEKFTNIIEASNSFKGYKVVDYNNLTSLQKETFNYIEQLKSEIEASRKTVKSQKANVANIEGQLAKVEGQLEEVRAEKDAIEFLGMPFSKSSYKSIMWGIVAVLVLALVFFIYRFKQSHAITSEAKKRMEETDKEFEAYRTKALEKEQRLGRLLQDERNKLAQKVG